MQRSIVCLFAALALVALGARAQDYPTKPIRVLVPFAPGGVVDTSTYRKVARQVGLQPQ